MKSFLVIGLGRFGKHLAMQLAQNHNEVMAVDQDESCVNSVMDQVTSAQIGDCKDEHVLAALGVGNFDVCFVCIGSDFQSSLEITSLLKDMGAKYVVSKAGRDIHAKFLLRNGADEVLYLEKDMARRTAIRFSANHVFDYVEIGPEYAIVEIETPNNWVGKTIGELGVRTVYGINIVAVKAPNGRVNALPGPNYLCSSAEHLIIACNRKEAVKFLNRRN